MKDNKDDTKDIKQTLRKEDTKQDILMSMVRMGTKYLIHYG